jgi:hypothetical protein
MNEAIKKRLFYAITACLALLAVDSISYFAIRILSGAGVFYDPSKITQPYSDYLTKRDDYLGWPSAKQFLQNNEFASDGSRIDIHYTPDVKPCLSLFGDSFTWGDGVPYEKTWGTVLSSKLGCRVANFGVPGYGTDQAYMRYDSMAPQGNVVFLNHLSENIIRNVNQFRNLIYPGHEFVLKPRYVLYQAGIRYVPMPQIGPNRVHYFLHNLHVFLKHEWFLPGGNSGISIVGFPYSLNLAQTLWDNYHIRAKLADVPRHYEFYDPNHGSGALPLTERLIDRFVAEAQRRGQLPVVTVIPTCGDLKYQKQHGHFPYHTLTNYATSRGYKLIDFGHRLSHLLKRVDPETLYVSCNGHFNEKGYAYLADIAYEYLKNDPRIASRLDAK